MSKAFYITTAIYYVNGQPHLGHAYEMVITDVIARARRSMAEAAFFLTGLDEHGQKVQHAAQNEGLTTQEYCDRLAESWRRFAQALELSNDDFIRTTEQRHKQVVQNILAKLHQEGHFYKAPYQGWYSTKQETFLTDRDRQPDGQFPAEYGEVTHLTEENYYFRLKDHQQWLIDHINAHPDFIQPDYRRNEVLGFLRKNVLEDLCISRPASRLDWGIPFPFDPAYVTYVWFDALVNYISVPAANGDPSVLEAIPQDGLKPSGTCSLWPADTHIIGKDILKFHAVYWPIMLKAMGLALPLRIIAHGFWQKDNEKMSKAVGNVVDPLTVIDEWGLDAFRYYVVRELDMGPDGNWTDSGFRARYNAELANGLGNLVNRALSMLTRYRQGVVPARADDLAEDATRASEETQTHLRASRLQAGLEAIWKLVARANLFVEQTAPFNLAKDPSQAKRLDAVLYSLTEVCRVLAVLLWPFLPGTASRIYSQLALPDPPDQLSKAAWGGLEAGHKIGKPAPLFPRKDLSP